jgi:hypothetical protein
MEANLTLFNLVQNGKMISMPLALTVASDTSEEASIDIAQSVQNVTVLRLVLSYRVQMRMGDLTAAQLSGVPCPLRIDLPHDLLRFD